MSSTAITPFRLAGLPPELVDMIWDLVFENEANNRVALVHRDTMRVVPSKTLISPFMAVDREVRERALRFLPSFPSGVSSDCVTAMFHRTRWVQQMGQASSNDHKFLQRYISARLSPVDCNTITSVVYKPGRTANFRYPLPWPGKLYYPASAVLDFWMANRFTRLSGPTTGGKYWTMEDEDSAALVETILQEGGKSLNLKEWQTGDDKRHGWRIWRPPGA
ncbi:hypothetical protein PG993_008857 [Apiospora rasikravindrae]|uniref:Uncharacterized protein n=1 Tax=Apiospora rasikravindrae TaxID=990691 RepID=A0ABR1SRW5_9PEZI